MPTRNRSVWVISLAVAAALAASALTLVERNRRIDARRETSVATSRFLALAATQRATSNPELALLLALEAFRLVEHEPGAEGVDARRALLRTARATAQLGVVLRGHQAPVSDVAVSPDGRTLASADSTGSIRVWSAAQRRQIASLRGPRGDTGLVFDPAGRWLASFTDGGRVSLWQRPWGGDPIRQWRVPSPLWSLAFDRDGRMIATGGRDGARLWRVPSGAPIGSRLGRQQTLLVAFSAQQRLVTVGTDVGVEVFDLDRSQRVLSSLPSFCADRRCSRQLVDDVAGGLLSPDGRTLGVVGRHGVVGFHDLEAPPRRLPSILGDELGLLAFTADGRTVAIAEQPYDRIRLYDVGRLRPSAPTIVLHGRRVTSTAFFPHGSKIAVGGDDGTVRILATRSPASAADDADPLWRRTDSPPIEPIVAGQVAVTATPAGVVRFAPRGPGSRVTLPGRADFLELSPDGSLLVTADWSHEVVTVWSIRRGTQAGSRLSGQLYPVGFGPDGDSVLFTDCCADRVGLVLWRRGAPPLVAPAALPPGEDAWGGAVFSRAAGVVAVTTYEDSSTGDLDERIRLFDLERLAPLGPPLPGGAGGFEAAFSPDGRALVYLDDARQARLWDVRAARPLSDPLRTADGPLGFSPDGTIVGPVTDPFRARPEGGGPFVTGVDIAGDWLRWELEDWRRRTCDIVRRSLTPAEWRRFLPAEPYRRSCP